jgi:NAD(P)-dependent dehydrogenase (short-subunit alcohol dehydrogenase family)
MASSELSRRSRASVEPSPPRRRSRKAETKVAFVTGASSGLGAEISLKLARRNWIVYAASRRGTRTDGVDNLHGLSVDVTDGAAVTAAIGRIFAEHGRLDAVIANAGVNASAPFEEIPAAAGRSIFETNFWGTVHVARAALPIMRRQRQGLILTTGSLAGLIGPPGEAFYAASKHALEGFLEALQYEVRPFGVRVVLVEPGFIRTNFAKSMAPIAAAIADYAELRTQLDAHWRKSIENGMAVGVVAERIVRAVESGRARFRLSIGTDAFFVPALKRLLPEQLFFSVVRRAFGIDGVRAKDKRRPVAVQEQQR